LKAEYQICINKGAQNEEQEPIEGFCSFILINRLFSRKVELQLLARGKRRVFPRAVAEVTYVVLYINYKVYKATNISQKAYPKYLLPDYLLTFGGSVSRPVIMSSVT
jgi:superfamily I DNA and RNA helicase